MSEDQITYWGLFAMTVVSFLMGAWIFLGIERFVYDRVKIVHQRMGEAPVKIFIVIMRVLGFLLVLVTSYLFVGLWRVFPCALK